MDALANLEFWPLSIYLSDVGLLGHKLFGPAIRIHY